MNNKYKLIHDNLGFLLTFFLIEFKSKFGFNKNNENLIYSIYWVFLNFFLSIYSIFL